MAENPTPQVININVPDSWEDLTEKQADFLFARLSEFRSADDIKTLCLLRWGGLKLIGRSRPGVWLLRKDKILFEATADDIVALCAPLAFIGSTPKIPRLRRRIGRRRAISPTLNGIPFEKFMVCDNLYQGFLQTRDPQLLDSIGAVAYPGRSHFSEAQRTMLLYWFVSLKEFLSRLYPDFLKPASSGTDSGNLLGSPQQSVIEAMNAQIRALTKGDITKEAAVLAMDTHRALAELNAQAREYEEIRKQTEK